ncbi:MAG: IS5/IS1182 family transposase, partial [Candidatus Thermoplasmatota archaeon]
MVRRGEFYISLDFMETWDEELEEMNYKKRGRPFHD